MEKHSRLMKSCGVRYRYLREDPRMGIHYATISFPKGNGGRGKIEVPASVLSNKAELKRQLQDRDAKLPMDQDRESLQPSVLPNRSVGRYTRARPAGR